MTKRCPACGGELEQRIKWSKPVEMLYACLGMCGMYWTVFDLQLASPQRKQA